MIAPNLVEALADALTARLGAAHVKTDEASRTIYGTDALKRGRPADIVVFPGNTEEVAAVALLLASDEGRGINGQGINVDGGSVLF